MRLLASGAPDGSFGSLGRATVAFMNNDDFGRGVALQSNGRIVLGGFAANGLATQFAFARVAP